MSYHQIWCTQVLVLQLNNYSNILSYIFIKIMKNLSFLKIINKFQKSFIHKEEMVVQIFLFYKKYITYLLKFFIGRSGQTWNIVFSLGGVGIGEGTFIYASIIIIYIIQRHTKLLSVKAYGLKIWFFILLERMRLNI